MTPSGSVQILVSIFGLILQCVWTYRTGAPTRACGDMTPQHGSPINTDPAPFLVEVSKTQYSPNERIYVRIRGCGISKFKGFMIQPRSAVYPNRPAFLGAFLRVRGTRYECVRSGAVLTHSSPEEKESVTLTWIAPPGPAGHVIFRVTFVQSYTNYWVGINSPVIYDGVSRDLTIMQAFSLQSATDQACLPTRQTTTRSTTTTVRTTTRRPTTPVPTTYLPTMPTEPYFTTTYEPTTTTTRRPTTTTRRPTTTRRRTTTTTTLPPPPPTTRRRTTTTTVNPTTTTDAYYYDYYWETSTNKQSKIATTAAQTTTQKATTTTTRAPVTTMKFYEPTTAAILPTRPTERTTTTTLPSTTTTDMDNVGLGTTILFPEAVEMWATTAKQDATTRKVQPIIPTKFPSTVLRTTGQVFITNGQFPATDSQLVVTERRLPATDGRSLVTDGQAFVTDGRIPVTDRLIPVTDGRIPVTDRLIPVTDGRIPVTDRLIPVTDGQIPVTDGRIQVTNELIPTPDRKLPVNNLPIPVTDGRITITDGQIPVTDGWIPTTDGQMPVPNGRIPVTERQVPVTDRKIPVTNGQMIVTDKQISIIDGQISVTNGQIPATDGQLIATDMQIPVTNREIPVTNRQSSVTDIEISATNETLQLADLLMTSAEITASLIKNSTDLYKPVSKSASTTIYPNTKTEAYIPRTTYYYDYDFGRGGNENMQNVPTDRSGISTDQRYIPTDTPYNPTGGRYVPTSEPYLPTEIIRNQSKYEPTPRNQYVPTTISQKYNPTTRTPVYPTTRRPIYPPATDAIYNPTSKIDGYLTFPPQTYTPEQPKKISTEYVSSQTTVSVAGTRQPTTKSELSTKVLLEQVLYADQECGVTQGCFDDCRNGVCNFIVSWKPERNTTKFQIRSKPMLGGQYWAAIGFSNDKMMGLDSVTECITEGDRIQVYQSYNLDYYRNMRLLSPKLGIKKEFGAMNNGIFSCSFTRQNFVEGEKDVFDLNKDWHMMFAEGPAVNGVKIPHRYDVVPPVTSERMDIQRYPPIHETYDHRSARKENIIKVTETKEPALVSIKERRITMDEACGSTKSCFQDCTSEGCRFIVTWEGATDHVSFTVRAVLNESLDQWIAIAFSGDAKMGEDSVVQCVSNGEGVIDIRHSYNDDKNNIRVEQAQQGLRNTSARFADGIFECSFIRDRVVDNERIFNLDRDWNIHFAYGKSKKGIMLPHTLAEKPHISDNAVDFSKSAVKPDVLAITASKFFIKIHAALMIFAWILCASVASVIGRYFQPYWWGEKMFGSKTWVKVHWLFVLITCAAVIGGFAVIFVGVDGISKLFEHQTYTFNGTHPIMGLVVSLLALLNPLLLCLRPSEDSSSRAFFNCLYWLVEIGAHVLAVVTIYAGFGLASFLVPSFFTFLIIGFTVYQILILLFMEALKSYDAKKTIERKKIYLYEMQIRPWNARKNNSLAAYMDLTHTSKGLKNSVLATHLLLLSALTTTMIVIIIINDKFSLP